MIPFCVLLEGPDCAGKTTIVEVLQEILPAIVSVRTGPPGAGSLVDDLRSKIDFMSEAMLSGRSVVVDRFHVGELVYGPLLRGGARITVEQANELDACLDKIGVLKVHVTADASDLRRRWMKRDNGADDALSGATLERSDAVRMAYIRLLGRAGSEERTLESNWHHVDTSAVDTTTWSISRLIETAQSARKSAITASWATARRGG